jgi:hypothetical protein
MERMSPAQHGQSKESQQREKYETSRAISDAELLKDGARYKESSPGNFRLEATPEQIQNAKKEMVAQKEILFPHKIVDFPTDPNRAVAIYDKFQEYCDRQDEENKNKQKNNDTFYKIQAASYFLSVGEMNPRDFKEKMIARYGKIEDEKKFINAIKVISDYAETGGEKVQGGTGLKEKSEKKSSYYYPDIVKFKEFVKLNKDNLPLGTNRFILSDYIYSKFYANPAEKKYKDGDEDTEKTKDIVFNKQKKLMQFTGNPNRGDNMRFKQDGSSWYFCNTHKGIRGDSDIGRVYINIKPEYMHDFFLLTSRVFENKGLSMQSKVAWIRDARSFNRPDKMLIYFNPDQENESIKLIEELYKNNKSLFEKNIPPFVGKIKDSQGNEMFGVGAAEDPGKANESFGTVRCMVLAQLVEKAQSLNMGLDDPRFNFRGYFNQYCIKNNVDPRNPALNLRSNTNKTFKELRNRLS